MKTITIFVTFLRSFIIMTGGILIAAEAGPERGSDPPERAGAY
jgi:hypothetical protein